MRTKVDTNGWTALIATAAYCVAQLPFISGVLAAVCGIVVCFLCTGVSVAAAVLPKRRNAVVWFTAAVACSVAVGVFGGLVLDLLPSGLVRFNWLTYALVITLAACLVAHLRGTGRPIRVEFSAPAASPVVKLTVAGAMVLTAALMSVNSFSSHDEPFTELWLVPNNPARSPLRAVHVELGVKSHELSTEDFTVVVDTGARTVTNKVTLAPGQVWTLPVIAEGAKARASLYRGTAVAGDPYRAVWLATR